MEDSKRPTRGPISDSARGTGEQQRVELEGSVGPDHARVFFCRPGGRNSDSHDFNGLCNSDLGESSERPGTYRMAASKWGRTENGPKWL